MRFRTVNNICRTVNENVQKFQFNVYIYIYYLTFCPKTKNEVYTNICKHLSNGGGWKVT